MRALMRSVDALLRRGQRIREFSDDPECLFRIRVGRAPRPLPTEWGEIPAGAPMVELHFWNEQLPRPPERDAGLAWGTRGLGQVKRSLAALARHLREAPELRTVAGVMGVTAFFSAGEIAAGKRAVQRLGFECEPYRGRLGRFGELWENVHAHCMLWAFNERAARVRSGARIDRMMIWMPAEELVRRYAPPDA
jgi:hypothetical protein